MDRILPGRAKMKFAQEVRFLSYFEPIVVRKSNQQSISIAIVNHVQIDRLVQVAKIIDGQLFGVLDIDRSLHPACTAQASPMARILGAGIVGILRVARLFSHGDVHVVSAVGMLVCLGMLLRLRYLPGPDAHRGRQNAEAHYKRDSQANAAEASISHVVGFQISPLGRSHASELAIFVIVH
jgi:hypothetical protein